MADVRFSVVIPTCDRSDYLKIAIKSVLEQSYLPYEILIIDNGWQYSEINFKEISSLIIHYKVLPRFGVAQARNFGAIAAQGDYIAFLDDDDKWDKDYLMSAFTVIEDKKSSLVLGKFVNFDSEKPLAHLSGFINSNNELLMKFFSWNPGATGSNTVVKRELFMKSSGYDPCLSPSEDKGLIVDLILKFNVKVIRSEGIVYYRQNYNYEKLSSNKKRIQGKRRFTKKYWSHMPLKCKLSALYLNFKLIFFTYLNDFTSLLRNNP